jgi:capsular exopolysaccharide synthesis family protein
MLPTDPKKLLPAGAGTEGHPTPAEGDPAAAGLPPALTAPPSLGTLLQAFRRCWPLALPLALLGAAGAAALAWYLVPGVYTAHLVLRLASRPPRGSLENEIDIVSLQKAQVALAKSPELLSEVQRRSRVAETHPGPYGLPWLEKHLLADSLQGPDVLHFALSGEHPEAVAALLTALGEVLPERVQQADQKKAEERIEQLRRRLRAPLGGAERRGPPTLAEQLHGKRQQLQEKMAFSKLDDQETLLRRYHDALGQLGFAEKAVRDQRLQVASLRTELMAKKERLKNPAEQVVTDADIEEELRSSTAYKALQDELAKVQDVIEDVKRRAIDRRVRHNLLLENRVKEADLERRLKDFRDRSRGRVGDKLKARATDEARKAVLELGDKLALAGSAERALEQERLRWQMKVDGYRAGGPKLPPDVAALQDQVKQLEKEVEAVGQEKATLQAALPIEPRVTRVSEVLVPTEKELNRPIKFAAASGVTAFGLLLVGVCLLESRSRRVYAAADVRQGLGLPVVGSLPALPRRARAGKLDTAAEAAGLADAVDALRTVLLHSPRLDGARVVMVTSAVGGEGKTTLASHLAASLARAWRKTLLIDGDVRKPAAHRQFELPAEPGFSEALRGEVEFDEAIRPTQVSRLWLLSAGKCDSHALQALAQEGLGGVFERLKEQYDFIVLDTSPVLPVPDALLLGKHSDVALLSVLKDASRVPAVYFAQQRLQDLGIRVLGAVVLGEKVETYGHAIPYPRAGG